MISKLLPSFIKVGFLSILFLGLGSFTNAQTSTITSNPGTSLLVVAGNNNNHASESIFLESEIGVGNFTTFGTAINRIGFF